MEVQAYIKNVKVTPKKLRFLLAGVKKLTPQQALDRLLYTQKKPAMILYKAIQSAVHNAKTAMKIGEEGLIFKTIAVEEGQKLKRYKAGGRGNVKPFKRKYAHIKVVLTVKEVAVVQKKELIEPVVKPEPAKKIRNH